MPADMNDYFKKKKPTMKKSTSGGGGGNGSNPLDALPKGIPPWAIIIGAIALALFILKPFTIINSGEVGIKVTTGKFQSEPLNPGLHFYIPVLQKVIPVNTRIRLITYSNERTSELAIDIKVLKEDSEEMEPFLYLTNVV